MQRAFDWRRHWKTICYERFVKVCGRLWWVTATTTATAPRLVQCVAVLPCKDSFNYHLPFPNASAWAFLWTVSTRLPPGFHYKPVTFQPEVTFVLRRYYIISTLTHESWRLRGSAYVFKKTARISLSGACWRKTTDSSIRTVTTTRANSLFKVGCA